MEVPAKALAYATVVGLAVGAIGCGSGNNESAPANDMSTAPTITTNRPERGPAPAAPYPGILSCVAEKPSTWVPAPSNVRADAIAQALSVTPAQVSRGKFGPANCDEAIYASQVGSRASVKGIGSVCLVIGLGGKPIEGKTYHEVLAVCAAPAGAAA